MGLSALVDGALAYLSGMHLSFGHRYELWQSAWNLTFPSGQALLTSPRALFSSLDVDVDGALSFEELSAAMSRRAQFLEVASLWPMTDWKIMVFLWRACGGALLLLVLYTMVPHTNTSLPRHLLRWPILGMTYFVVGVELAVYAVLRLFIWSVETVVATPRHRALRNAMEAAESYSEWKDLAVTLDGSQGRDKWQRSAASSGKHNWHFIREVLSELRRSREAGDADGLMAALYQCTRANVGGVMHEEIFSYTNSGEPKDIVTAFIDEVHSALDALVRLVLEGGGGEGDLRRLHKLVKNAKQSFGSTALCLSGGAAMGNYHFGICKALFEEGVLPDVISGTSAGAVVGSFIATRTDEEIRRDLTSDVLLKHLTCFDKSWFECLCSMWSEGALFRQSDWLECIEWWTFGDMTFEEAFQKTGRTLSITLSVAGRTSPPVLLNHVTAPNVVVGSAVLASAAVPGFINPMRLRTKAADGSVRVKEDLEMYFDGSITNDIPTTGLAESFNCKFFIVGQANPHVVPFFFSSRGSVGQPSRWTVAAGEEAWRGGFLLSVLETYLKVDMLAKMHFLQLIEAPVGFTGTIMTQDFDGSVTIVPRVSWVDYLKLMSDPTPGDMARYLQRGQVAAWRKVSLLRLHFKLKTALATSFERIEAAMDAAPPPKAPAAAPRRRSRRPRRNHHGAFGYGNLQVELKQGA